MHTLEVQKKIERRLVNDSRAAWIKSLADTGMSAADAARHTGMSKPTLFRNVTRFGIKGFNSGLHNNGKPKDTARIYLYETLISEGLTAKQISERTGHSDNAVRQFLSHYDMRAAPCTTRTPRKPKEKKVSQQIYEMVRAMIDESGWSLSDISHRTGIPVDRIRGIAEAGQ